MNVQRTTLLDYATPPLTRQEEQALAERSRAGNIEATSRLAMAQLAWVHELSFARRSRTVDAEEAFSIALLGLMMGLADYDPARGRLSTFTTYRVQSAFWRFHRRKRLPTSSADVPDERGTTVAETLRDHREGSPADAALKSEQHDQLRDAIAALPPKERTAIRRKLVGRTREETAAELSTTAGYVRILEQAAVKRLRTILTGTEAPTEEGSF